MVVDHPFRILNASGNPIRGDLRYTDDGRRKPLILICHGFNTSKDWGPFPFCGISLAESGFATIVFNFSHNGVGEGSAVCTDYRAFSRNTPGRELEDIQAVLRAVSSGEIGGEVIDPDRIGMAGHSRGAGMSILTAASDQRIRAVVAWSTVSAFLRVSPDERARWVERGYHPLRYGLMRTMLRYDRSVLDDMDAHRSRYDLEAAARTLNVPTLFIHGDSDSIVPVDETLQLFHHSEDVPRKLEIVKGADHTYGTVHPFAGSTPELNRMLQLTSEWFHTSLKEENA